MRSLVFLTLMALASLAATMAFTAANAASPLSEEKLSAATELLERNGIDADISIDQFIAFGNGGGVVSGFQLHDGMKVFDGRLTYHFAPGGTLIDMPDGSTYRMNSPRDLSKLEIDTDSLLDAKAAVATVRDTSEAATPNGIDEQLLASVRRCARDDTRIEAELGILEQRPVWQLRCKFSRSGGVFVDAENGELIDYDPDAATAPMSLPLPVPNPD